MISQGLLCCLLLLADPSRDAFESALQSLSSRDYAAAERGFLQVLETYPANLGALGNLGVVYMRLDRPLDAARTYERALKLAPKDPLLHMNLGLAYLKLENYGAAKQHFAVTVSARPENAQARQLLATTQIYTGEAGKAVKTLEVMRGEPGILHLLATGYLKLGKREEAKLALDEMFRKIAPAQAQFLTGRAFYESAMFDDAVAALEKAKALDPSLPGVERELGKALVGARRTSEARAVLEGALRANAADAEAQYYLGTQLVQEGAIDEGIRLLEKSAAARPAFWGAFYHLGKAQIEKGDADKGLPLLEKAASLTASETDVYVQLSRAYRGAGREADARRTAAKLKDLKKQTRSAKHR